MILIKGMETSYSNYPAIDYLRSEEAINFLPKFLRVLLTFLSEEK